MVAAFKVMAPVFKVPPGATVPVFTVRAPMVPPAPVMVPLVREVNDAFPSLPVTFKVPLITSMLSFVVTPAVESALRVRVPTPSNFNVPACWFCKIIWLAKVLLAMVEFKINWVLVEILVTPVLPAAPILKAPPETMVPSKVTTLVALPVMVAPVVKLVVPVKLTPPVFRKTGVPERTVVPAKETE